MSSTTSHWSAREILHAVEHGLRIRVRRTSHQTKLVNLQHKYGILSIRWDCIHIITAYFPLDATVTTLLWYIFYQIGLYPYYYGILSIR
jgi:hypothetical protein